MVYDDNSQLWFYTNVNTIWNKSKSPLVLKGLLSSIISKIFYDTAGFYSNLIYNETDESKKELYKSKSSSAMKLSTKLEMSSYISSVVEVAKCDFNINNFYETKFDSNGNLFAFKNKVLD